MWKYKKKKVKVSLREMEELMKKINSISPSDEAFEELYPVSTSDSHCRLNLYLLSHKDGELCYCFFLFKQDGKAIQLFSHDYYGNNVNALKNNIMRYMRNMHNGWLEVVK